MLSAYSFNHYYIKSKEVMLSNLLSRQNHEKRDLHVIIPISFNMQEVLHARYYNIHENEQIDS